MAEYEVFNYFYRNYFLSRKFNSVTNNSNNSYDNLNYTESDRKGRVFCQIWLQGGIHNETPTDKNLSGHESPWRPSGHNSLSQSTDLAKLNPNCNMNYLNYL